MHVRIEQASELAFWQFPQETWDGEGLEHRPIELFLHVTNLLTFVTTR